MRSGSTATSGELNQDDETLVNALADLGEPVTFTALNAYLRRAGHTIGSVYGRLELLALAGRVRRTTVLGEAGWAPES